ncbi:Nucleoporin like [Actinidia chinensis var. chinensis]|uniref:Nucleoporin like n=1 Tax=Actinidia chinensis var. chinensis TaxID=1590841 RepID=A0A2R6Q7Z5_ACTCC|nr:Nucleoporin like [Actinidia chinensis var. chinensis]
MSTTFASHTLPPPQPSSSSSSSSSSSPDSPPLQLSHRIPKNVPNLFVPIKRRHLLASLTISLTHFLPISIARARGLFQIPSPRLGNRYFLVIAGESEFESQGVINMNQVANMSVGSGLSERGKKQTARAALELNEMEACERELLGLAFNYSKSLSGCRDYWCSEWGQLQSYSH